MTGSESSPQTMTTTIPRINNSIICHFPTGRSFSLILPAPVACRLGALLLGCLLPLLMSSSDTTEVGEFAFLISIEVICTSVPLNDILTR